MSIIKLLASQQGLKGSGANIALAKEIAASNNTSAIKELVANLSNKDKNIQSDCIKTIYETGYINPTLIADDYEAYLALLPSKNNRLVWGSMVTLASITDLKHKEIFKSFDLIKETIEKGSVITVDCGIDILAKLNKHEIYSAKTEPFLVDLLWNCPIKQLPQYMEKALVSVNLKNMAIYIDIIEKRKAECNKESQVKRLEKVLRKIEKFD